MKNEAKFLKTVEKFPHAHTPFFKRPFLSRRNFFSIAGAGVTGSFLANNLEGQVIKSTKVTTKNTAKNVIFILLTGAPSHTDTFDLKFLEGTTPKDFNPTQVGSVLWPMGLMPKIGAQLGDISIARSVRAWAAQHSLSQTWVQIGRSPAAALGDVAPNIGSIVAIEKKNERQLSQKFPSFLALNSGGAVGSGFLPATYEPFKVAPSTAGLPNTTNADGALRFDDKYSLMNALDGSLRVNSPVSDLMTDYGDFYRAARGLMYNPTVDRAFKYTAADSLRYGNTTFGNALLTAKQVLEANQGTRYIQVSLGGWDMHTNIYGQAAGGSLYTMAKNTLDPAVGELIRDLKANGTFNETLIVMMGEFGRTVGPLTMQGGRDHFLQQFCMFAGGGTKGGQTIGGTDARGAVTTDSGWSEQRDIRPEDIEATIYSALGINWTNVRYDDPFGRGFEYVPSAGDGLYKPIHELWG